ncbi:putative pseudouridine synthase I, TruA, pseudouridine synthase, catalytic domain superfamily [Helianthus debilis subsp. tardiflorus]
MDPFHRLYAYHNLYKLNTCVMKEATKYFVGGHDFSAFANTQRIDRVLSPVKNIFRMDIIEKVISSELLLIT